LGEDAVAPEFGGDQPLREGNDGHLTYEQVVDKNRPSCSPHKSCAGRGGSPATRRPCTYKNHCPHGPPAGHARAMHA
ncbi:hypothetical protein BAE44_0017757, partial [Dichanthelium oligosanthes]